MRKPIGLSLEDNLDTVVTSTDSAEYLEMLEHGETVATDHAQIQSDFEQLDEAESLTKTVEDITTVLEKSDTVPADAIAINNIAVEALITRLGITNTGTINHFTRELVLENNDSVVKKSYAAIKEFITMILKKIKEFFIKVKQFFTKLFSATDAEVKEYEKVYEQANNPSTNSETNDSQGTVAKAQNVRPRREPRDVSGIYITCNEHNHKVLATFKNKKNQGSEPDGNNTLDTIFQLENMNDFIKMCSVFYEKSIKEDIAFLKAPHVYDKDAFPFASKKIKDGAHFFSKYFSLHPDRDYELKAGFNTFPGSAGTSNSYARSYGLGSIDFNMGVRHTYLDMIVEIGAKFKVLTLDEVKQIIELMKVDITTPIDKLIRDLKNFEPLMEAKLHPYGFQPFDIKYFVNGYAQNLSGLMSYVLDSRKQALGLIRESRKAIHEHIKTTE